MEEEVTQHEFDVIIIGAGGAGLRAAIEASRSGVKVAMICKSMLGKAHTVMAEGGAAAALANKDPRDSWQTHFRDTMKGGKYLGDWRMAQIHAQQAPDRIRELEQWGAVFDRTPKGLTSQRNFGGHTYPRLAHIGDATGLELIRTLQQKGIHEGIQVLILRRGPCTGLLGGRRDGRYGICTVSPNWNDLAAFGKGNPRHRGCSRRGWDAEEQ